MMLLMASGTLVPAAMMVRPSTGGEIPTMQPNFVPAKTRKCEMSAIQRMHMVKHSQ